MIKVEKLNFKIDDKKILDNISFEIKQGERLAIIGGNGSGKTTLMEAMLGLNKRVTGKVIFDFEYNKSPQEHIGVQFQDSALPQGLTVRNIIEFFEEKTDNIDKEFQKKIIKEFGIEDFIDVDSSKLSGGQQQKTSILLALMSKNKVIFMDELTTGLDILAQNSIHATLYEYLEKTKSTLVLITHSASEIVSFADRVITIKQGKIISDLSKKDIIKKYKDIPTFLKEIK